MSKTVHVELGDRSYDIHIGAGLLTRLGEASTKVVKGRNCLLATDATVSSLYGTTAADSLTKAGCQVGRGIVPSGEASKDGQWLFHLYEKAIEQGLDRKSFVVALGGGVVGDLAGYMAASYLRGIPYVQVPTTLLAMVDSSIGGKTGINLPQGKNLVGAFHQPSLVIADTDTLKSLPKRELVSGLAEVIKYGVIRDAELFRILEKDGARILALDAKLMEDIIVRSCAIKAEVVRVDEKELGVRAILNFGHTLGHAVETVTGYGRYLHGEAIAIGMAYAARLSVSQRALPKKDCERLLTLLQNYGLPIHDPQLPWQALRQAMGIDKKSTAGKPRLVLADKIGLAEPGIEVPEDVLQKTWEQPEPVLKHGF
ncbi:MAG TPA: 3-dehydroquinate synthase [Kiritimatiellia bacterium]